MKAKEAREIAKETLTDIIGVAYYKIADSDDYIDGIKGRLRLVCKMLKEEDREEIFTMCKYKGYHAYGTPEELKIILAGDMIRDIMDDMNHLQDK